MWEPWASEITTLALSDISLCWQYLTDPSHDSLKWRCCPEEIDINRSIEIAAALPGKRLSWIYRQKIERKKYPTQEPGRSGVACLWEPVPASAVPGLALNRFFGERQGGVREVDGDLWGWLGPAGRRHGGVVSVVCSPTVFWHGQNVMKGEILTTNKERDYVHNYLCPGQNTS